VCVALGIQHAMRKRHIVICGLSGPKRFYTTSHKWHSLWKKGVVKLKMCKFDVWLTVHRSSKWNKKPTRCHLVLYLFLLYKLLNMFRATLCPSSGADNLVVFLPRVV